MALEFAEIPHGQSNDSFHDSSSLLQPDAASSSSSALPLPAAASAASAGGANPNARFYQIGYYQSYFDVTTSQVCDRMLRALVPFRGKFYRDDDGSGLGNPEKADLYGPFWICTTLIFLLAAAGNFANYIEFINTSGTGPNATGGHNGTDATGGGGGGGGGAQQQLVNVGVWTYDFQKVTIGASVFYSWISLVPLAVYCFLSRVGSGNPAADGVPQKGLVEIASLFGYALAIMLPVCIICIVPVSLVRWVAVGVAFAFSSFFLLFNLGTSDVNNKTLLPVIAAILVLNFGIAVLTKFYFFEW